MLRINNLLALLLLCSTISLSACGSGSDDPVPDTSGGDTSDGDTSGSDNSNSNSPLSGVFLDSAVQGVQYSSVTQSGTTDANGTYLYLDGETVTFTLNGTVLGETLSSEVLTPMDLQDVTKHSDYGLNIIRLLMTLDADGNPENGIAIETAAPLNVDFNQSTDNFAADTEVIGYISANTNTTLVSLSDAITHFSSTQETIGATSSYTVDLTDRTATSVITTADCGPTVKAGWNYSFSSTGYSVEGSDSFNNCSVVYTDPLDSYAVTFGEMAEDFPFDCATSVCTYAELNKTVEGIDLDGRNFYSTYFHTPGTNIFTYIKTVTAPANEIAVYTEVITLNQ